MPNSHHLALVQGSSSSKPWADNGPFQAAWCLQPARALAMVSLPGMGSGLAPALDMPALSYERKHDAVCWGDAPEPTFQLLGERSAPFLLSSILLAHQSPFGCCSGRQHGISQRSLVLEHQHGPQLCVEGFLAASLWEPPSWQL